MISKINFHLFEIASIYKLEVNVLKKQDPSLKTQVVEFQEAIVQKEKNPEIFDCPHFDYWYSY